MGGAARPGYPGVYAFVVSALAAALHRPAWRGGQARVLSAGAVAVA